jgi:hypothetical protein
MHARATAGPGVVELKRVGNTLALRVDDVHAVVRLHRR